ncbi:hypothetical protein F183_A31930 [Bryobacterales bacterium F-183]|nr:hypothetical protein F183_A31930 [Bryobacterales bacterium F-183]
MSCAARDPLDSLVQVVKDYTLTHPYSPRGVFQPRTLRELVKCVQQAEAEKRGVKAQGSGYSLSNAAVADDYLICTDKLNKWLSRPFPASPKSVDSDRFRDGCNQDWLQFLTRPGAKPLPDDSFLIHVEAGIKIKHLLADLDAAGLALPTMGAGGGQSLAGAMSTGTHGSDFLLPPLFDNIRAVHLVGPGGQEWWIEPGVGPIGGAGLNSLPYWCPDTKVVRSDEWLHAPVVCAGRCGVIYSVVLQVTRQFRLRDRSEKNLDWKEVRKKLKASEVKVMRDGTVEAGGLFRQNSPEGDGQPQRFFQVTVDLAEGEKCWITRRWLTNKSGSENTSKATPGSFDAILCQSPKPFAAAIAALQLAPELVAAKVGLSLTPFVGPVWVTAIDALFVELAVYALDSPTTGDFLARVIERCSRLTDAQVGAAGLLRDLVMGLSSTIIDQEHDADRWGKSHEIVDGHPDKRRGCISVHSAEFFFDASADDYLQFLDKVLESSKENHVPGYASLRYMGRSRHLMAMQRHPLTVSIEIAFPRRANSDEDFFQPFVDRIHLLAKQWGGIPHWGQRHVLSSGYVESLYQMDMVAWRYVLAELEQGYARQAEPRKTFSTVFSRKVGLEPLEGNPVATGRRQRDLGAFGASLTPLL